MPCPGARGHGRQTVRIQQTIIDPTKGAHIAQVIREGEYYGMPTFDQSLVNLLEQGIIDLVRRWSLLPIPHDLRVALQRTRGSCERAPLSSDRGPTVGNSAPEADRHHRPERQVGPKAILVLRSALRVTTIAIAGTPASTKARQETHRMTDAPSHPSQPPHSPAGERLRSPCPAGTANQIPKNTRKPAAAPMTAG